MAGKLALAEPLLRAHLAAEELRLVNHEATSELVPSESLALVPAIELVAYTCALQCADAAKRSAASSSNAAGRATAHGALEGGGSEAMAAGDSGGLVLSGEVGFLAEGSSPAGEAARMLLGEALALYGRAEAIALRECGAESEPRAKQVENAGMAYFLSGDFVRAERKFLDAQELMIRAGVGRFDPKVMRVAHNAAVAQCKRGPPLF